MADRQPVPRPPKALSAGKTTAREERRSQALRANLAKRKAQARAREAGAAVSPLAGAAASPLAGAGEPAR